MLNRTPIRAQLATVTAQLTSAIRMTTYATLSVLLLVILTLIPAIVVLWKLALS